MADIPLTFPDIGNALMAGAHARYYGQQADLAGAEEQRRKEAQPYVQAAMGGDATAMGKIAAGDPKTAVAVSTALSRMDANQRAQAKEQGEWGAQAAHAILQADPQDRPAVYQQLHAEGLRRGYKMTLPPTYSPQLDGILRSHRAAGQSINDWFKQNEGTPQPMGPASGGGAAPGGGGPAGAIGGIESGGRYDAVGPVANPQGNRAYGKYQVLDSNIGPWTQEILGKPMTPQEFLANPQAQDAVFNAKFGQYAAKYGPSGAARAWFAGEGGMNNPNAKDVLGTSVAGYEGKFNAAGGAAPGVPGPVAMPPPPGGMGTAATAQMPGPPTNLVPPGPPPAQMPGGMPGAPPAVAQGDGGGNPQQQADPRAVVRGVQLPPGARIMGVKGVPVVKDGTVMVMMPDGTYDFVPLPQRNDPAAHTPQGFRWANGQQGGTLEAIPGGPQDPSVARRLNVPPGYQPGPDGGLAHVPGGPADPAIIERNADMRRKADEKAVPPAIQKALQENVAALKQLDRVGELLGKTPDSVGGAGSVAASIIPGGEWVQNRMDKDGVQLRALISDIAGMTIHDRSGAAVSVSEFKRLRPYIPSISDDKATIERKLANFRAVYEEAVRDTAGYYGPDNGFKPYTPATDYLNGGNRGQVIAPAAPPAAAPASPGSLKLPPKDGAGRPPLESFGR